MTQVDDPSQAVAAAFITDGDSVSFSFFQCWDLLMRADGTHAGRTWQGGVIPWRAGTDGLADARNQAVEHFLKKSDAHWLWWVDTDMGFPADTVERLLEAADPKERPIVGALCFANRDVEEDGLGGRYQLAVPVIGDWKTIDGETGFDIRWNYPQNTVVKCDGTGSACILIHRSVFERIAAEFGPNWYTRSRNPSSGEMISEDYSFCIRAGALNIPVHVHTGVKTTHHKSVWLSEDLYWEQRALNAAPPMVEQPAEPSWKVPRFAIIPTHNRPARLTALVIALGSQCDHIVVLDNASAVPVDQAKLQSSVPAHCTVEVWQDEEQPPNLARFWNFMFQVCRNIAVNRDHDEWDVAVFNDDAIVPAGWYDIVSGALRDSNAVVAHTGDAPTYKAELTTAYPYPRNKRMCPWAFVVKGEAGLRADESMRFWFFDDDFNRAAIDAGGVLAVPGPLVFNAQATQSAPALVEVIDQDRKTFVAKWGGMP